MKAVQMMGLKQLKLTEVPMPEPKGDELLLKVMAVGICGSDIPRALTYGPHVLPIILGHEFAGEVIGVGDDVKGWQNGERATVAPLIPCNECEWCRKGIYSLCTDYMYYGSRNDGAFAEYLAVKAVNAVKLDKKTPFDWGAAIDPAANALHAFYRADAKKEDTLAVYGLGAIGLFALQYAKAIGMKEIIAVDIDDDKLEVAKQCGATFTINSLNENPVDKLLEYTNGVGTTIAFDMSGSPIAQEQAILSTAKMGTTVFLGISHKELTLSEKAVDNILRYQLSVKGSWNSFSNPFPGKEWTEAARLMDEKKFDPELLISHKLTLEEVPDIFDKIDKKAFVYNKIMFYPHGLLE